MTRLDLSGVGGGGGLCEEVPAGAGALLGGGGGRSVLLLGTLERQSVAELTFIAIIIFLYGSGGREKISYEKLCHLRTMGTGRGLADGGEVGRGRGRRRSGPPSNLPAPFLAFGRVPALLPVVLVIQVVLLHELFNLFHILFPLLIVGAQTLRSNSCPGQHEPYGGVINQVRVVHHGHAPGPVTGHPGHVHKTAHNGAIDVSNVDFLFSSLFGFDSVFVGVFVIIFDRF